LYLSCFAWTIVYDSIYAFQVVVVLCCVCSFL